MLVAGDLDELDRMVTATSGPVVLVFDADNTLVPQGASVREFQRRVEDTIERFEAMRAVSRVVVLTNGPDRQAPEVIYRGNKPWTTRKRLGLEATQEAVWVIGDQILTDGLLAWRIGAAYILLAIDIDQETSRQATMRRIGRRLSPIFFTSSESR